MDVHLSIGTLWARYCIPPCSGAWNEGAVPKDDRHPREEFRPYYLRTHAGGLVRRIADHAGSCLNSCIPIRIGLALSTESLPSSCTTVWSNDLEGRLGTQVSSRVDGT